MLLERPNKGSHLMVLHTHALVEDEHRLAGHNPQVWDQEPTEVLCEGPTRWEVTILLSSLNPPYLFTSNPWVQGDFLLQPSAVAVPKIGMQHLEDRLPCPEMLRRETRSVQ